MNPQDPQNPTPLPQPGAVPPPSPSPVPNPVQPPAPAAPVAPQAVPPAAPGPAVSEPPTPVGPPTPVVPPPQSVPGQPPVAAAGGQASTGFAAPSAGKFTGFGSKLPKNKPKLLAGIVLTGAVAVIAAATVLFVLPNLKGIALEEYSGDEFSILAPKDYERKDEAGGISFDEKGDEDTQSKVLALVEKFPTTISKEQQDQALAAVDSSFKEELQKELDTKNTIEDYKVEKTTFKNNQARVITATVKDGSKTAGKVKMVVGVSDSAVYFVAVLAHQSDKALAKNTDKIIDSFEVK